jgi:hypothetical protein
MFTRCGAQSPKANNLQTHSLNYSGYQIHPKHIVKIAIPVHYARKLALYSMKYLVEQVEDPNDTAKDETDDDIEGFHKKFGPNQPTADEEKKTPAPMAKPVKWSAKNPWGPAFDNKMFYL